MSLSDAKPRSGDGGRKLSSTGRRIAHRPQLADEVADGLREQIMSGRYRFGEFLRLEHIADELGISVTPVREALVTLRGQGFLELQPRRGYVVAPLTQQDIKDAYRVQADVAGELTARATREVTDAQIEEMSELQRRLDALEGDPDQAEVLNHRFHRMINTASDSRKLVWFLEAAVRYAPLRFYAEIYGWTKATVEDHHPILEALRSRDADAARDSMHKHITHAGELLVVHLDKKGLWNPRE